MVSDTGNIDKYDTWPKLLKYNYDKYTDRHKAMRHKHFGIWRPITWKDYYLNVKYLALGLLSLGFKTGDKLVIVGDNAPEWYFAQLAAQSNHGVSIGLYSDLSPSEIKYVAADSQASYAIVEDQEQIDKILQIKNELPGLKKIIYWRYNGLSHYKNTDLLGFRKLQELGREFEKDHPGLFEDNIASGQGSDICSLVYTSGTTSENPKGAIHSHQTLRYGAECYMKLDPWRENDDVVSYLPPAWITEQWLSFGCHLLSGSILNFPEDAETQQQDIREIGPTMIFFSARLWERQAGSVLARIQGSDPVKSFTYRLFMPLGHKIAESRFKKQKPSLALRLIHPLAHLLLFRPLKDSLGLSNARICYTAGATLCPEVIKFYHALGVPLKSLYGSTEGGAATGSANEDIRPDTVGTVNVGAEIRIDNNGEILSRQPGAFLGYYNDPGKTAEVLREGWFYSGDKGALEDDGHLVFIDRIKDIVKLKSQDFLAPQSIESKLKFSPYIKDAWVTAGPNQDYISVILIIDLNNISKWADKRKVTYTTYSDLSQKPEIYELMEMEIQRVNNILPPSTRIKKYVNLHKEFDPDESELTRTRKLRRSYIESRYKELINAIYSDRDSVSLEAQVMYSDLRTGVIKTEIKIRSVGGVKE